MNKKRMAELIAARYPVLFNEFNKESKRKNHYYLRMFEAVALATVYFQRLDGHLHTEINGRTTGQSTIHNAE